MPDPLQTVWDALHNAGCKPHGETHRFRAACPAHQGTNNESLLVYEGANGAAVLGCYAHSCQARAITNAIGLQMRDLFPDAHRNGHRPKPARPVTPRPLNAGAALLDMVALAGFPWKAMVVLPKCPYCDNDRALLWVHSPGGLDVECPDGCNAEDVRRAIEARAAINEKLNERQAA